jgi:hypothetical protein
MVGKNSCLSSNNCLVNTGLSGNVDIGDESHVGNNVCHETWDTLDVSDKSCIVNESCQGGNKIKVGDRSCHGDNTCILFSQPPQCQSI